MKLILLFFLSFSLYTGSLYAGTEQKMLDLYQSKHYKDACNLGYRNFSTYKNSDDFLSLYSMSCLEADYIDRLALPIAMLKSTKEARANSAYLSIIFMQKKLLYHALIDDYDIFGLNLPTTNHILSKVFDLYVKEGKKDKKQSVHIFSDPEQKNINYKLYIQHGKKIDKMVIEKYQNNMLLRRHVYW